jgi:hypothetical protein
MVSLKRLPLAEIDRGLGTALGKGRLMAEAGRRRKEVDSGTSNRRF